jgi:hypothetical protein
LMLIIGGMLEIFEIDLVEIFGDEHHVSDENPLKIGELASLGLPEDLRFVELLIFGDFVPYLFKVTFFIFGETDPQCIVEFFGLDECLDGEDDMADDSSVIFERALSELIGDGSAHGVHLLTQEILDDIEGGADHIFEDDDLFGDGLVEADFFEDAAGVEEGFDVVCEISGVDHAVGYHVVDHEVVQEFVVILELGREHSLGEFSDSVISVDVRIDPADLIDDPPQFGFDGVPAFFLEIGDLCPELVELCGDLVVVSSLGQFGDD